MTFRELAVPGAWEITPTVHSDQRGVFLEAFTDREFTAMTGHRFDVRQVNTSVYVSEGLAHGFLALQDHSTVSYMCSAGYDPSANTPSTQAIRRSESTGRSRTRRCPRAMPPRRRSPRCGRRPAADVGRHQRLRRGLRDGG